MENTFGNVPVKHVENNVLQSKNFPYGPIQGVSISKRGYGIQVDWKDDGIWWLFHNELRLIRSHREGLGRSLSGNEIEFREVLEGIDEETRREVDLIILMEFCD